jgi:hypothetical protein
MKMMTFASSVPVSAPIKQMRYRYQSVSAPKYVIGAVQQRVGGHEHHHASVVQGEVPRQLFVLGLRRR